MRGIRYREQRKKNQQIDGIEGEELDPLRKLTLAGLEAHIDPKRQLVLYRDAQGRDQFTDTGPLIVMHDKGADSLEAALRLAAKKYGGKVDITGSSEFREPVRSSMDRLLPASSSCLLNPLLLARSACGLFGWLEPCAGKHASTVLRGRRRSNAPLLPGESL